MKVGWSGAEQRGWHVLDVADVGRNGLTAARQWAEAELAALGEVSLVDTLIIVSELLEKAYLHAGGPSQLRIHHAEDPCEVTVAVADGGRGEPRLRAPDHRGGRGLLLVDRLSLAWGVSHHDDGKLVWARVDCAER